MHSGAHRSRYLLVTALVQSCLVSSVLAQERFTQDELRALPRVCLAQKFVNRALDTPIVPEAERAAWAQQMGPAYEAFHHYCWGLIDMRRASSTNSSQQAHHYRSAVGNFEYVERNADASFPLFPELLLRKGMALRLLGEDSQAARNFTDAIRAKKDYTPAYAALIDLYVDLGDVDGARDVLEQGLRQAPESKILLGKKRELDGGGESGP